MNSVYLSGAVQSNREPDAGNALSAIPLLRRMTALQKAVMAVLVKGLYRHTELLNKLKLMDAPLYFTSAYGEFHAMIRVTQSIEQNSLPVSPKDFQHSVLNAALAYFCMHMQSHQSGFAISGGYESADITLHLATRRIAAGLDFGAVVIHADETGDLKGNQACAEMLILTKELYQGSSHVLESVSTSNETLTDTFSSSAKIFDESQSNGSIPWLLEEESPALKRAVRNSQGIEFYTQWREVSDDYQP